MNLTDVTHLKNLSWYTTVPLAVCAWMLQDSTSVTFEITTWWQLAYIAGGYFGNVIAGLFLIYPFLMLAFRYLGEMTIAIIFIAATFLLALSAIGAGVHFLQPPGVTLPGNVLWFAACASLAFNLFQMSSDGAVARTQPPSSGA